MTSNDYSSMEALMRAKLSSAGFDHCRRTAETAGKLAAAHGENEAKARLAGLVHDIARDMPARELLASAVRLGETINEAERARPYLLHDRVGADIIGDIGLKDHDIAKAVATHTFGATDMTKLDKIVYLADKIEPGRNTENAAKIRRLAEEDIDKAFFASVKIQLIEVIKAEKRLHPKTIEVWNRLVGEKQK